MGLQVDASKSRPTLISRKVQLFSPRLMMLNSSPTQTTRTKQFEEIGGEEKHIDRTLCGEQIRGSSTLPL